MKGTWGALQSKPVTTELPGLGAPQLQVVLPAAMANSELRMPVRGLEPRPMGTLLLSSGQDMLQCDAMALYTHKMWKAKEGWGWSLEQDEHVFSSVTAAGKRKKKERKTPRLNIHARLLPFLPCVWKEVRGLSWLLLPWVNVPGERIWWQSVSSSGHGLPQGRWYYHIFKKEQSREKPASLWTSLIWRSTNSFHGFGTAPYVQGGRGSYWVLNYREEKHLKFLSIYTHNFSKSLYTNPLASAELLMGYRAKKEVEPSSPALSLSET